MKAVQYQEIGRPPEVVTLPTPEPGPGEVLLRVTAAGVCRSDLAVMESPADTFPYQLPMTLGHEGVGTVAALGEGAVGVSVGEAVAVFGPQGCGSCVKCAQGKENYCLRAAELGITPPGLGSPGAMAEYLVVRSPRHLVPLGDLDPATAAPLTDAGLTPYHAVRRALPKLAPGNTAVVIGIGGLGHAAVQLLRALTASRVVALDVSRRKLDLARSLGAHATVLSDERAAKRVRALTGGHGAEAVFDCVGTQPTVDTAGAVAAVEADVALIGLGGGTLPVGFGGALRYGVTVYAPYWGNRVELSEVIALAHTGDLHMQVERYTLDDAPHAYDRLRRGLVDGRAVVVPGG